MPDPVDVGDLQARLARAGYLADAGLATALACAVSLGRAVLLEGDAGVGKTDAARALAAVFGADLLRLQCYEGLDLAAAAYDWNYGRQLLAIRAAEAFRLPGGTPPADRSRTAETDDVRDAGTDDVRAPFGDLRAPDLYADEFLIRRPLLAALGATCERGIVLLIDEIDRADDEFEAFLLEFLADFAISIPERGTVRAAHPPIVVLTSNRTRDLHDALKRRCFYHWIAHPPVEREIEIIRLHLPHVAPELAADVARAAAALRERALRKPPGIAESLDWAQTLTLLGAPRLDEAAFEPSLGSVLKYPEDIAAASADAGAIVAAARRER